MLSPEDFRNLAGSQKIELARKGIPIPPDARQNLAGSELMELAKMGIQLTPEDVKKLANSQKVELALMGHAAKTTEAAAQLGLAAMAHIQSTANESVEKMTQTSRRIFLSHADKDKQIVDALIDLLHTGANIQPKDIFCTSAKGLGIPTGTSFSAYIKEQIQKPDVVIVLLSDNYYKSKFCLCELGAAWAMSHKIFPLTVPNFGYDDLQAVLVGMHVRKLDRPIDLTELKDELSAVLHPDPCINARWEDKRNQFIERLPALVGGTAADDKAAAGKMKPGTIY